MRPASIFAVTILLACTDQSAEMVSGVWRADNMVPGSSIVLTIAERGTTISGDGTYSIEGGRSGTLRIAGGDRQSQVRLALSYDYGQSAQYTATVQDNTHMRGTVVWSTGAHDALAFSRIPRVP